MSHRENRLSTSFGWILLLVVVAAFTFWHQVPWPPGVQDVPDESPVIAPEETLDMFFVPPGYRVELVASEPLVQDPVAIDFDADGRMWVAEMRGYMPNIQAEGEREPNGKIVVLEDITGDGQMDNRTVFLDSLVLPRAIKVMDEGVLVAAPPYLWFARDTTGDMRADEKEVIREDYGDPAGNPEHNANGLIWGIDNWIHNARYGGKFRYRDGSWEYRETPRRGQWEGSIDDYGRLYFNYNEDPLRVDLVPAHYLTRNPNLNRTRGVYVQAYDDKTVWPVRPTPGVNRGYRDHVLREDSSLAAFTAAGSPIVFRGDQLPDELRNDVFVTEPAGNLIQRFVVEEDEDGMLMGRNPYEEASFLASTDERFRPVNLKSAPDGTLYVVDMYRGIIQHREYLTPYLQRHIEEHGLDEPVGLGRIYRVVHDSYNEDRRPQMSGASPRELVAHLSHRNGWWRDTAQRLLVERQATSVAPELRELSRTAEQDYTRLHALWTLEGLGEADPETLQHALSDTSPHVRAAAIRISEPFVRETDHPLTEAILDRLNDEDPVVRRQLTASLGELPLEAREYALAAALGRYSEDPIVVSLVVSGLHGRELRFLERVLEERRNQPGSPGETDAVVTIAITILNSDKDDEIQEMLSWIGDEALPDWQRLAMIAALDNVAPSPAPGRVRLLELEFTPDGLLAAIDSPDEQISERAEAVAERLHWPGKPVPPAPPVRALTEAEERLYEMGREGYQNTCAVCHQPDGEGMEGVATPLVESEWVLGDERDLVRIILHGFDADMLMPPAGHLSDEQIAAIATFLRRSWGHEESPVNVGTVRELRGLHTGRERPWTEEELTGR